MAFNPKGKSLKDVKPADISKKSLQKLAKKYNSQTGKKAPFFIQTEFEFADGSKGPLFVFGKLNAFKKEIKEAVSKNPLITVRGLAHMEVAEDGKSPLLVLSPVKGKALNKEAAFKKTMKEAFTTAWAAYKVGAEIDEAAAEAAEAAAEAEADDVEGDDVATAAAPKAEAKAAPKAEAPKTEAAADKKQQVLDAYVAKLSQLMPKFEAAMKNGDKETAATLDKEIKAIFAKVQGKK